MTVWAALSASGLNKASFQKGCRGIAVVPQISTTASTITKPRAKPNNPPSPRSAKLKPLALTAASTAIIKRAINKRTPINKARNATIKRIVAPGIMSGSNFARPSLYMLATTKETTQLTKDRISFIKPRKVLITIEHTSTNNTR